MNPLAVEMAIIQALKDAIPDTRIGSAANFAGSVDLASQAPAILVVPGPADPVAHDRESGAFAETQTWSIEIVVLAVPDHRHFTADFQQAGALIGQAIETLAGFAPGEPYRALKYHGRGETTESRPGLVHFPLEFSTTYSVNPGAVG